jgi:hypothetical protein
MAKYRKTRLREGSYLFLTQLPVDNSGSTWEHYLHLTEIEEAFRNLKGDLAVRPVRPSAPARIEAHIFVSFLAYCLHMTLRIRCQRFAPNLTPRSVLEQLSGMQMVDVLFPTTDGRMVKMSRYTRPDKLMVIRGEFAWTGLKCFIIASEVLQWSQYPRALLPQGILWTASTAATASRFLANFCKEML